MQVGALPEQPAGHQDADRLSVLFVGQPFLRDVLQDELLRVRTTRPDAPIVRVAPIAYFFEQLLFVERGAARLLRDDETDLLPYGPDNGIGRANAPWRGGRPLCGCQPGALENGEMPERGAPGAGQLGALG